MQLVEGSAVYTVDYLANPRSERQRGLDILLYSCRILRHRLRSSEVHVLRYCLHVPHTVGLRWHHSAFQFLVLYARGCVGYLSVLYMRLNTFPLALLLSLNRFDWRPDCSLPPCTAS